MACAILAALLPVTAVAASTPGDTTVSTKLFINASDLQYDGVQSDDQGWGVDLKRFYIDVDHQFGARWSARVTTDVQWARNSDPTDLWFKHAYLQGDFGKALTLRIGAAPLPWAGFANQWGGYRYIDKELITRAGVGGSSDWGVHALGQLSADGSVGYAVAALTGGGYKKATTGDGVDVAARVSWQPTKHTVLGVGTYRGTLAQDAGAAVRLHTAKRWTALAAYADDTWRVGAQWFRADNWRQVTKVQPDAARGWSAWASWKFAPHMAVFVRHDRTDPSLRVDPSMVERYDQLGLEWQHDKHLRLALVGKRDVSDSDFAPRSEANEVGFWAQVSY